MLLTYSTYQASLTSSSPYTIPVVCQQTGTSTNISGTVSVTVSGMLSSVVSNAYLNGGAVGGTNQESDTALLSRLRNIIMPTSALSIGSIAGQIQTQVPQIVQSQMIGPSSQWMIRDIISYNGNSIHTGGKADIYVRCSDIQQKTVSLPVQLITNISESSLVSMNGFAYTTNGGLLLDGVAGIGDEPGGTGTFITATDPTTGLYIPPIGTTSYCVDLHPLGDPILLVQSVTVNSTTLTPDTDYIVYSGNRATTFSNRNRVFLILNPASTTINVPSTSSVTITYLTAPSISLAQAIADQIGVVDILVKSYNPVFFTVAGQYRSNNQINFANVVSSYSALQSPTSSSALDLLATNSAYMFTNLTFTYYVMQPTGNTSSTTSSQPMNVVQSLPMSNYYTYYLLPPTPFNMTQVTS